MSLASLKAGMDDRRKVLAWLDHIGETDKACRAEVLQLCKDDPEARAYYVKHYTDDCV